MIAISAHLCPSAEGRYEKLFCAIHIKHNSFIRLQRRPTRLTHYNKYFYNCECVIRHRTVDLRFDSRVIRLLLFSTGIVSGGALVRRGKLPVYVDALSSTPHRFKHIIHSTYICIRQTTLLKLCAKPRGRRRRRLVGSLRSVGSVQTYREQRKVYHIYIYIVYDRTRRRRPNGY